MEHALSSARILSHTLYTWCWYDLQLPVLPHQLGVDKGTHHAQPRIGDGLILPQIQKAKGFGAISGVLSGFSSVLPSHKSTSHGHFLPHVFSDTRAPSKVNKESDFLCCVCHRFFSSAHAVSSFSPALTPLPASSQQAATATDTPPPPHSLQTHQDWCWLSWIECTVFVLFIYTKLQNRAHVIIEGSVGSP